MNMTFTSGLTRKSNSSNRLKYDAGFIARFLVSGWLFFLNKNSTDIDGFIE